MSTTSSWPPWEWVDWHNNRRLHTACHDLTPVEYEQVSYGQHPAGVKGAPAARQVAAADLWPRRSQTQRERTKQDQHPGSGSAPAPVSSDLSHSAMRQAPVVDGAPRLATQKLRGPYELPQALRCSLSLHESACAKPGGGLIDSLSTREWTTASVAIAVSASSMMFAPRG